MGNLRKHKRSIARGSDTMMEVRRAQQRMTRSAASIASEKRLEIGKQLKHEISKAVGITEKRLQSRFDSLRSLEIEHKVRITQQKELVK